MEKIESRETSVTSKVAGGPLPASAAAGGLNLADGAETGALSLPAPTGPEDMFRSLAIGDHGDVFAMLPTLSSVQIVSLRFP